MGPPFARGESAYFLAINRNKRSIKADLKHPQDVRRVLELASRADIIIEVSWLTNRAQAFLISGKDPGRLGNAHPSIMPCETFHAGDKMIAVAVGNDLQFRALCKVIEHQELANDNRFTHNPDRVKNRESPTIVLQEIAVPAHQTVPGINANIANNANNGERVRAAAKSLLAMMAMSALLALLSHARNGSASFALPDITGSLKQKVLPFIFLNP